MVNPPHSKAFDPHLAPCEEAGPGPLRDSLRIVGANLPWYNSSDMASTIGGYNSQSSS